MGCDSVKEPPVMADDNGAAGKILKSLFKRPQGVDIEIIGWLIKKQDVRLLLEDAGEVDPVSLPA